MGQGWKESLVGRVLTMQTWVFRISPQNPCKMLNVLAHVYKLNTGETETGEPLRLSYQLAYLTMWVSGLGERLSQKIKTGEWFLKNHARGWLLASVYLITLVHIHKCTQTCIHTEAHTKSWNSMFCVLFYWNRITGVWRHKTTITKFLEHDFMS